MAKTMKRRIFSGQTCEQIVYQAPDGLRLPKDWDPEKPEKKRFKDESEYIKFKKDISKRNHARRFNATFVPGDLYSTLTFDDDWEVHTFEEARKIRNNYIRVLRRKYQDAVIFAYMGRGKGTNRIHFHFVTKGIPEMFLKEKWKYGRITHCRELRAHNWYNNIDYGADYTGLANYLFEHWTHEVGGHHWFQTKNAQEPEKEEPTEVKLRGGYSKDRPPRPPKGYKFVEAYANQYGYLYFKYVVIPPPMQRKTNKKSGPSTG